jgi:integrase
LKQDGKSFFVVHNHISPVLTFYEVNDIALRVKKIKRYYPSKKRVNRDRAYTHDEIHRLLDIADERIRAVILLLASSGMRIGAIPLLRLRNLEKVSIGYDQYIYKIIIYENEEEEYFTFCTPECAKAVDLYLDVRTRYGEKLNENSLLIREQFDTRDSFAIRKPISRPLCTSSMKYLLRDIAIRAGLRTVEQVYDTEIKKKKYAGSIRKEVPIAHGFRKFFTTQLIESDLKTELRWLLEGHNLKGNDSNYIRTTEKRLQQEYEKAIDNLTIDPVNRLQRTIQVLKVEKSRIDEIEAKILKLQKIHRRTR